MRGPPLEKPAKALMAGMFAAQETPEYVGSAVCAACHTDRDATWAATEIADRFGRPQISPPHYGRILAAAARCSAAPPRRSAARA